MAETSVREDENVSEDTKEEDEVQELFNELQQHQISEPTITDKLEGEPTGKIQYEDLLIESDHIESHNEQPVKAQSLEEELQNGNQSNESEEASEASHDRKSDEDDSDEASKEHNSNEVLKSSEQLKQESEVVQERDGNFEQAQEREEEPNELLQEDVAEGPSTAETESDAPPPTWLTNEFLQELFASPTEGKREYLTVTSFEAKPALGKGENYSSVIWRVGVNVLQDDQRGGKYE